MKKFNRQQNLIFLITSTLLLGNSFLLIELTRNNWFFLISVLLLCISIWFQNKILNENVWHLYYEKPDKNGYYLVQLEDGSHLVIKYLDGNWRCEKIHTIFYWCEIPNKPKHW